MKGRNQNILMLVAVAALIFLLFNMNSKSDYSINEREYSMFAPTAGPAAGPSAAGNTVCGGMNRGTGLASSLLPREVASAEDFGQFAPEDILKGQNFLEPRAQVGFLRPLVVRSVTRTNRFARTPPTPRIPSCGTTPLSFLI